VWLPDRVEERVTVIGAVDVVSVTLVQSHVLRPAHVTDHQVSTLCDLQHTATRS